jgi:hypothetical protein
VIRERLRNAAAWRLKALVDRLDSLTERSGAIERRLDGIEEKLTGLRATVEELGANAATLPRALEEVAALRATIDERVDPMLRVIVDKESENRRALYGLRADPAYASAFTDPDPLVSIVIATVGRAELVGRALPSLLSQSHANIEVLVVGDHAPPQAEEALASIGDPRVRYWNLTQQLSIHKDPRRRWLVGSTMARNEAARHARGQWLMHFDDDDHLRPNSIAGLLALAREQRAEVSYGGFEQHHPAGGSSSHIGFPPRWGTFAWPAALIHGGLRFFERELVATHLELPGDVYLLTRMLRVGVRFAMLDEVVLDYFPAARFGHGQATDGDPVLASLAHPGPVADRSQG